MKLSEERKREIKSEIVRCLCEEPEIIRLVVFGSFSLSDDPDDLDLAIYQNSQTSYMSSAMKYRRLIRPVTRSIPVDVVPIRPDFPQASFFREIEKGEVIYER
jgi:uncharacterized protein